MAAPEGTITVKLVLDATEFHAELDKVIQRLETLGDIAPEDAARGRGLSLNVTVYAGEHVISADRIAESIKNRSQKQLQPRSNSNPEEATS